MTRRPPHHPTRSVSVLHSQSVALVGLAALLAIALGLPAASEAKRKPVYRPQPDLRILTVTPSATAYSPQDGPMNFAIEIELPKDLKGATILEVSSFISSPSKRSMRFLSNRQPVENPDAPAPAANAGPDSKPRLAVTLTWDGTDQRRQVVEQGVYQYEVRAKLLAVGDGDRGPRTQMISWPKRGTLEVK